jgi:hypothetical protein
MSQLVPQSGMQVPFFYHGKIGPQSRIDLSQLSGAIAKLTKCRNSKCAVSERFAVKTSPSPRDSLIQGRVEVESRCSTDVPLVPTSTQGRAKQGGPACQGICQPLLSMDPSDCFKSKPRFVSTVFVSNVRAT